MANKSITYQSVPLSLRTFRKESGVSQTQLAKALTISQSQVSQWEISGRVPGNRIHDIGRVLDLDLYLQDDLDLCGDLETVEAWKSFIRAYSEHIAEDKNSYLKEFNEHPGVATFLGPLVDSGFSLPSPPIYRGDREELGLPYEETDSPYVVEYQDAGTEYFFDGDLNPFSHFWSYHGNFRKAWQAIHSAREIDDDGYISLPERDICAYVWYQSFKAKPLEEYPLPQCRDFIERFEARFLYTLQQEAQKFEKRVHQAWLDAYRSSDPTVNKPTWLPGHFLNEAGDVDFEERIVFSEFHIEAGLSPDPYIRGIQEQLARIEHLLSDRLIK